MSKINLAELAARANANAAALTNAFQPELTRLLKKKNETVAESTATAIKECLDLQKWTKAKTQEQLAYFAQGLIVGGLKIGKDREVESLGFRNWVALITDGNGVNEEQEAHLARLYTMQGADFSEKGWQYSKKLGVAKLVEKAEERFAFEQAKAEAAI